MLTTWLYTVLCSDSICLFATFFFQKVKQVVGIELSKEAVEDAKVNAAINGNITASALILDFIEIFSNFEPF